MSVYLFEIIEHEEKYKAKIFVTSIEHSSFHWHYDYELILILKGSLIIKVGSKIVLLEAKNIILLNSQEVHELQRTQEDNLCLFIQINKVIFSDLKNNDKSYYFYLNSNDKDRIPKNGYSSYINIAARIGLEGQKREVCNIYRIKSLIYMIVADLFEFVLCDIYQNAKELKEKEDLKLLMYMIDFIKKNCKENTVLEQLYKSVGLCEKSVYRFLKANIGLSPRNLVLNNRIENAKYLLKFSNKSIDFIACNCGFCSESTFYRTFKKILGVTPTEYRDRGVNSSVDSNIKGYLRFDISEAIALLKDIAK
ncbi:MAG: AraC family transcriptional regulator [Firmicutes bacterium]|nr:AraC family transcriptional regulator [Bacillota bacterium]